MCWLTFLLKNVPTTSSWLTVIWPHQFFLIRQNSQSNSQPYVSRYWLQRPQIRLTQLATRSYFTLISIVVHTWSDRIVGSLMHSYSLLLWPYVCWFQDTCTFCCMSELYCSAMSAQWVSWNASTPTVQWGMHPSKLVYSARAKSSRIERDELCGSTSTSVSVRQLAEG